MAFRLLPRLLLCSSLFTASILTAQTKKLSEADVQRIHRSLLIIDTHNDVPMKRSRGFDIAKPSPQASTDVQRLRAGNVGATFFAAYVPAKHVKTRTSAEYCRQQIDYIRENIAARNPDHFMLALTSDDILAARKQGKVAALIGIEGGHAIEDSLEKLREFYKLGARYMTLTHSNTNSWGDSSGDIKKPEVKHHNGLTDFGKQVVSEMNRLGMIVDVSHVADKTFWDALEVSKAPIFASHSSCRTLTASHRNMTDDMIKAMAKKGGVIQINFACGFVSEQARVANPRLQSQLWAKFGDDIDAAREHYEQKSGLPRATLADVVAHIDHVVKIAGIDAVGIGSDFDGIDCTPVGLEDVSKFPNLTRALLEKGYTANQLRKIYGQNTLRVMRAVEKTARSSGGVSDKK